MFYPVESLRRGGRFYYCWVADSWPLRFDTITHRQLWSQDIRQICDDLLQVMNRESGYASARFSLRLSSQLMRGLVRLYQRKVNVFLGDLCMMNATAVKDSNKKWGHEATPRQRRKHPRPERPREEIPENEERLEERILTSGNIVGNIEEITLKEMAIPEIVVTTDGFGEENQEQALQQLMNDRTLEEMLGHTNLSAAQHSDLLALDNTGLEKSHEKSRVAIVDAQMERISEDEMTFRKSTAVIEPMQFEDIDKDVLQIPDCTIPELPVPSPEKELIHEEPIVEPQLQEQAASKEKDHLAELQLEKLEVHTGAKRKRPKKLIIDKKTKISGNVLRQRLENIAVELRCEDSSDDIIDARRLPSQFYMQRPANAIRPRSAFSDKLCRLFKRNLGYVTGVNTDKDMEWILTCEVRHKKARNGHDEPSAVEEVPILLIGTKKSDGGLVQHILRKQSEKRASVNVEQLDIADLPTQILRTSSQETLAQKRPAELEEPQDVPAKRYKRSGYTSFKLCQIIAEETTLIEKEKRKKENQVEVSKRRTGTSAKVDDKEIEEPIPDIPVPQIPQEEIIEEQQDIQTYPEVDKEKRVSQMLHEVGLADAENILVPEARNVSQKTLNKSEEDTTETPLGSLDRTKVDLGDSDKTTDTQRFLRKVWGTQGTMLKVVKLLHRGVRPLLINDLLELCPVLLVHEKMVAALCFSSLLKLKQHEFVILTKDFATSKITDIAFGRRISSKL